MVPQPLAYLEEDIREVLKKETGADIFTRADHQPEFRTWKHDDAPIRKVRKSLVLDPWEKDCLNVQLFQDQLNNAQVPDDSLLTSSLLMTPIPERADRLPSPSGKKPHPSLRILQRHAPSQVKNEWEAVVYGKTEDQLIMTEQARQYLGTAYPSSSCSSRALVL